jgi:hypothetical protein
VDQVVVVVLHLEQQVLELQVKDMLEVAVGAPTEEMVVELEELHRLQMLDWAFNHLLLELLFFVLAVVLDLAILEMV